MREFNESASLATVHPVDRKDLHDRAAQQNHTVQFYEDEEFLYQAVADFLGTGLRAGEQLVVLATEPHRQGFLHSLAARGFDVEAASGAGQLTMLDASETLAKIIVDGMPDWDLFLEHIGSVIEKRMASGGLPRVRAYGELVDVLWRRGDPQAAIRLEELWNDFGRRQSFSLLCAYLMGNFYKEAHIEQFEKVCGTHTHVLPTESYTKLNEADAHLRQIAQLQQRARALESEIEHRRALETALRESLLHRERVETALRESREELADFIENAVEGLHCVGPDGIILWANQAELDLLQYSREEYVGHPIAEFHADPDVIEDILARLGRNETLHDFAARVRCKDGSIKHVLIHSNALFRNGKLIHTHCFTRDITDRKRMEAEREGLIEDLSRTLRFSEMFVGILGHDLRNPLSAISTAASLLARRSDSDKVAKPAARILTSTARMSRMIDQLLDFTRIRLGKGIPLQRETVNLAELCRLAVVELEKPDGPEIRVEAKGEVVGVWDGDRLSQMLSNLIGNAVQHGMQGALVLLCVDGTDGKTVEVAIQNEGEIPHQVLPVVFEPFRSGIDKKEEGSQGLGLGLYISRQIALAHCGTIEVESSEAIGTRFMVKLPRSPVVPRSTFTPAEVHHR